MDLSHKFLKLFIWSFILIVFLYLEQWSKKTNFVPIIDVCHENYRPRLHSTRYILPCRESYFSRRDKRYGRIPRHKSTG